MKIAIYGSAFDPPHCGHMDAVAQLTDDFDKILLVPSYSHAFGKNMSPINVRVEMLEIITAEFLSTNKNVSISLAEKEIINLNNANAVYSYDLLHFIKEHHYQTDDLYLVIGPDNAKKETWKKFYKHKEIENDFNIKIVKQRLNIRSTQIRSIIANNSNTTSNTQLTEQLSTKVGKNLANYLTNHNLY